MPESHQPPNQPPTATEDFDDRRPLAMGCVLALVVVLVLGGAFALGAWSVLKQGGATP